MIFQEHVLIQKNDTKFNQRLSCIAAVLEQQFALYDIQDSKELTMTWMLSEKKRRESTRIGKRTKKKRHLKKESTYSELSSNDLKLANIWLNVTN